MKTRPEYVKCKCDTGYIRLQYELKGENNEDIPLSRAQHIYDKGPYDGVCPKCGVYYFIDVDQMDQHYDLKTMNTIW